MTGTELVMQEIFTGQRLKTVAEKEVNGEGVGESIPDTEVPETWEGDSKMTDAYQVGVMDQFINQVGKHSLRAGNLTTN